MADDTTPAPRSRKAAPRKTTGAAARAPRATAAPRKARARKAPAPAKAVAATVAPPTPEQIATQAYFLWQAGGQDPVANWLAAERTLGATG